MDDYLFTRDIDVSSAHTRDDLAAMLRVVHIRADRPSLRALELKTRHYQTPLSKTVVSEMLRGTRFPRKATMLSFLRACGVPEEAMDPWRRSWERVAAREQGMTSHRLSAAGASRTTSAVKAAQDHAGVRAGAPLVARSPEYAPPDDMIMSPASEAVESQDMAGQRSSAKRAPGPLVRRRELGALLRQLRLKAGLTIEQVAERLLCSPSKVSRMETGFRPCTLRDIRDLCDLYGVTDRAQHDYLVELARESKKQGWWQSYDTPFGTYIGLEGGATSISVFHPTVVPGLLQTADYARAITAVWPNWPSPESAEQHVAIRLRRQALLDQDNPPRLHVVVDEAALRRRIGSSAIMKAQLDQIVRKARLPKILIQVIPFDHGAYTAMDSNFSILEFPGQVARIVHVEGLFGFMFLERPQEIERYRGTFRDVQSAAASNRESIEIITKISRDMDYDH